jgi:ABC-type sugar transport system permease subunit
MITKGKPSVPRLRKPSYQTMRKIHAVVFLLPWIVGFLLFFALPIYSTVVYSFSDVSVGAQGGMDLDFNGAANYIALMRDELSSKGQQFLRVFVEENARILISAPVMLVFSLFAAILINSRFRGRGFVRVVFFLPIVTGLNVVQRLLSVTGDMVEASADNFFSDGLIMHLLTQSSFLPLEMTAYVGDAVAGVVQLTASCGVQTLIFLAGLQSINPSLYEVAQIEGANPYEIFWKITFPMLSNVTTFVVIYSFVDLFLSSNIASEIYNYAFMRARIGLGAALSALFMVNVLLDLLLVLGVFRLLSRRKRRSV